MNVKNRIYLNTSLVLEKRSSFCLRDVHSKFANFVYWNWFNCKGVLRIVQKTMCYTCMYVWVLPWSYVSQKIQILDFYEARDLHNFSNLKKKRSHFKNISQSFWVRGNVCSFYIYRVYSMSIWWTKLHQVIF